MTAVVFGATATTATTRSHDAQRNASADSERT